MLVGPGENAGVIDAGDGIAVAIRIESHNHPSAIEPYQGAATGVGGILRDVFTMGARPLAVMDPLFFGELTDARQRWLVEGVVSGISGYGNSVGVPTIGGELTFDDCYRGEPAGERALRGGPAQRATGARRGVGRGQPRRAARFADRPRRDRRRVGLGLGGLLGLTAPRQLTTPSARACRSATPTRRSGSSRPASSCSTRAGRRHSGPRRRGTRLRDERDRGARGRRAWTSTSRRCPCASAGMVPYEIMTSESQERMLAIITPENLDAVAALCAKWEVRASVVGRVVEPVVVPTGVSVGDAAHPRRLRRGGPRRGARFGARRRGAPLRPTAARPGDLRRGPCRRPERRRAGRHRRTTTCSRCWSTRRGSIASTTRSSFLNTVVGPGRDAALLRLAGPGLPRFDARYRASRRTPIHAGARSIRRPGTALTVVEGVANLACVGASAKAVVNCLNFGNPEHPEVMWQLANQSTAWPRPVGDSACPSSAATSRSTTRAAGADIDPTPVIGLLGVRRRARGAAAGLELARR